MEKEIFCSRKERIGVKMDRDLQTMFFAIRNILDKVPMDKDFVRLNPVIYGKTIMGIPIQSRNSLTSKERLQYRADLIKIFQNWTIYGHEDWYAKQISGLQFTVKFIRKDSEEGRRYRSGEYNDE